MRRDVGEMWGRLGRVGFVLLGGVRRICVDLREKRRGDVQGTTRHWHGEPSSCEYECACACVQSACACVCLLRCAPLRDASQTASLRPSISAGVAVESLCLDAGARAGGRPQSGGERGVPTREDADHVARRGRRSGNVEDQSRRVRKPPRWRHAAVPLAARRRAGRPASESAMSRAASRGAVWERADGHLALWCGRGQADASHKQWPVALCTGSGRRSTTLPVSGSTACTKPRCTLPSMRCAVIQAPGAEVVGLAGSGARAAAPHRTCQAEQPLAAAAGRLHPLRLPLR